MGEPYLAADLKNPVIVGFVKVASPYCRGLAGAAPDATCELELCIAEPFIKKGTDKEVQLGLSLLRPRDKSRGDSAVSLLGENYNDACYAHDGQCIREAR